MEVKKKPDEESERRKLLAVDDEDWAFLEEIDAPMWVDLTTLISTQGEDDISNNANAGWFELLHPFHRLSSYHFLTQGGNPSPTLPPSVSKSRGKHYSRTTTKWANHNHPINTFCAKPKLNTNFNPHFPHTKSNFPTTNTKFLSTTISSGAPLSQSTSLSVTGSNPATLTMSRPSKTELSFSASNSCIKSKASSSKPMPQTNSQDGLLLAVRASLRRSNLTRQPARVEVKEEHRQPKDRKSSSSKSSVGSTTNSGCNLNDTPLAPTVYRNTTPESKQVAQLSFNINDKVKHVKKVDGQRLFGNFCSKRGDKVALKNKTSLQSECRKSSRLQNVQNSHTDGKRPTNYIATTNARSATGQTILNRGTACKENNIQSLLWPRKALKHSSVGKTEDALDSKGSDNARNKSKKATKVAPKEYFR